MILKKGVKELNKRKFFDEPELKITKLIVEDVITTSAEGEFEEGENEGPWA